MLIITGRKVVWWKVRRHSNFGWESEILRGISQFREDEVSKGDKVDI